jgi:hypothetical protein
MRDSVLAASAGTALLVTLVLLHATAHSGSQRTALVSPGEFPTSPLVEYITVHDQIKHPTHACRVSGMSAGPLISRISSAGFLSEPNLRSLQNPAPYEIPLYPGVTDADQSPDIPEEFVKEEEDSKNQERQIISDLERQGKREDGIDHAVAAVASYVDDELAAMKRRVLHINVEDTSEIDSIVPQQGPEVYTHAHWHTHTHTRQHTCISIYICIYDV